jgi:AcrR family transcriptional regulator
MRKKPVQARSRQMVENIVEAAAKVVAEEGLAALTTNRVADVAGVSNGSLYQYFQNREDLLEALTERAGQDVMALFDKIIPQLELDHVDVRVVVRFGLQALLDFLRSNPLYFELIRNWSQVPLEAFLEPMERYWLRLANFHLARTAAEQTPPDMQVRLYVLFNSVFFNLLRYASQPTPFIREGELLDALADSIAAMRRTVDVAR